MKCEDLQYSFNENCAYLQATGITSLEVFNNFVRGFYPEISFFRKKENPSSVSKLFLKGLKWQNDDATPPVQDFPFNLRSLVDVVPSSFPISQPSDSQLQIQVPSNVNQDDIPVLRTITLNDNRTWQLKALGHQINLREVGVDARFDHSERGINDVVEIVKKMNICRGKECSGQPAVRTSSVHKISTSHSTMRVVRATQCSGIIPFSSKIQSCRLCSKVKIYQINRTTKKVQMTEENLRAMLKLWIPNLSPTSLELVVSQFTNNRGKQNQWNNYKDTLMICLRLWIRSKQAFREFKQSTGLSLPSESTLRRHKNALPQESGLNEEQVTWMRQQADALQLKDYGRSGGLLLDEMAIQPGIELVRKGKFLELVGMTDLGHVGNAMQQVRDGKAIHTADHVLQITFHGFSSFIFPIAHFPTSQVSSSQLYVIFWQAVKLLETYGFTVYYCSLDGAQANRSFMEKCLKYGDPSTMTGKACGLDPVNFIMDVSHVIKKIRNGVLKSKKDGVRHLTLPSGKKVEWAHFVAAFEWDQLNPVALHRKLTKDHVYGVQTNTSLKMRNFLAEDVLDENMLYLMKSYASTLEEPETLQATIEFLTMTAVICSIFRDSSAISQLSDHRILELEKINNFFQKWKTWALNQTDKSMKDRRTLLLSTQTMQDIQSCLVGFMALVKRVQENHPGATIVPANINSDPIENGFSQQRCLHHGANSNPTYASYAKAQNSVALLQPLVSKKGNAGASFRANATPFNFKQFAKKTDSSKDTCRKLFD